MLASPFAESDVPFEFGCENPVCLPVNALGAGNDEYTTLRTRLRPVAQLAFRNLTVTRASNLQLK